MTNKTRAIRFIEVPAVEIGEDFTTDTKWWLDTERPLHNDPQKFKAVQTEADKNANDFVRVEGLRLLFNDQAEYYAVCESCHAQHKHGQWFGSTRSSGWRKRSEEYLILHQTEKGWCQFCDPIFGNGGWND